MPCRHEECDQNVYSLLIERLRKCHISEELMQVQMEIREPLILLTFLDERHIIF